MEYEITDLVLASRPAEATEDWYQTRGVMDAFNAADDDEAVTWLDNDLDGKEADLNAYRRVGWRLVATRRGAALWASKEDRVE